MAQRGGLSHIHYTETRGLKVAAGQFVTTGSVLTRQGNKWKAGLNVADSGTLFAKIDGTVYFTRKRSAYRKTDIHTVINIKPQKPAVASAGTKKAKQP